MPHKDDSIAGAAPAPVQLQNAYAALSFLHQHMLHNFGSRAQAGGVTDGGAAFEDAWHDALKRFGVPDPPNAAPTQLPEAPLEPLFEHTHAETFPRSAAECTRKYGCPADLHWGDCMNLSRSRAPEAGGEAEKAKAIGPLGPAGDAGEKEASDPETVRRRITEYLSLGGLFNPEMMDHQKVSRLVQDARDAIERLLSERKGLREALEQMRETFAMFPGCRLRLERPHNSLSWNSEHAIAFIDRALAATSAPQDNPKVTK